MTERHEPALDHDFTPPEGEGKILTDSEAATALAAGDSKTFLKWMTQQQFEASRRPDSTAEYDLQVRIALAYFNASRTEGPEDQAKHKAEALKVLTEANAAITRELGELSTDWSEAAKRPDREARTQALRGLIQRIIELRAEIMR